MCRSLGRRLCGLRNSDDQIQPIGWCSGDDGKVFVSNYEWVPNFETTFYPHCRVFVNRVCNTFSVIDSVVEDLCRVYPDLYPGSDEKMNLLKSEVSLFWTSPEQEKAEVISLSMFKIIVSSCPFQFFAGFPTNFKYLPSAWEKLKEIGKNDKPWTEDEQELRDKSVRLSLYLNR